jgi:4-amino-4-deoxy-L-arabinose transferase-like glycosyltransferase
MEMKEGKTNLFIHAIPYILCFLAFALRMYRLDYQSIWRDEGVSIHLAASSLSSILADRAGNVHPPLYFILLHLWAKATGLSVLSVRFFSLIFSVVLVSLVYRLTRRTLGIKTALLSAGIVTLSPLYIVYAQETRVYSMLPLFYLLLIYKLDRLAQGKESQWPQWLGLALLEVVALHLHYFSLIAVGYLNLYLLAVWLLRRTISLHYWLFSQALVALLCLPWAGMVLKHWMIEGPPRTYFGDLAPPSGIMNPAKVISQVWHFSIGGFDFRGHRLFTTFSLLVAIFLATSLVIALRSQSRQHVLKLLSHWSIPILMTLLIWWWRPMISPRYIIMFTPPFFILLGHILAITSKAGGLARLSHNSLALALVVTFLVGLRSAYFDPAYSKDDLRGLGTYLTSSVTPNDIVLVHPLEYGVDYYYTGSAPLLKVDPDQEEITNLLQTSLAGKQRAFLAWPFGTLADQQGILPFFLEMNGRLVDRVLFRGYWLNIYELYPEISLPELQPASANFGDVLLTGIFLQKEVEANTAICLALRWQLTGFTSKAYKATVTLWDEMGHCLSSTDVLIRNRSGLSTQYWELGEEAVNFYVMPLPLGTPPGPYQIRVGVYDEATLRSLDVLDEAGNPAGVAFDLGRVTLTKARDFERDPYGTRSHLSLESLENPQVADGLALEGFAVEEHPSARTLSILMRWHALRSQLPSYHPRLRLRSGDKLLIEVESPLFETRYPTTMWSQGEIVFDQVDIVYSSGDGQAVLEMEIQGRTIPLKEVELRMGAVSFEIPPMQIPVGVKFGNFAELLGYDIDRIEVRPEEKVRLTLYWKAISDVPPETAYTVFTHLLNEEGHLIGQHDGPPAGGNRPTTGWVKGEVITDVHEMEFRETNYTGKASIEIGLYNPYTMERVLTQDGEDHLILPTQVLVVRK